VIGVVDYEAGNAPSVLYALARLGIPAAAVTDAEGLEAVERIVLPGVGAARATLESLAAQGLLDPLRRRLTVDRVPFLGICIGLQVLLERSEEGPAETLGLVPGEVRSLPAGVRIPQIGWNTVEWCRAHPLFDGVPQPAYCYFVNSYVAHPADDGAVAAVTDYGGPFCSVLAVDNLVATQFHCEKSGEVGLAMLANFAGWDPAC
jgi:glutamine amidotransferase